MGRIQNTFAKRQPEAEGKRKAIERVFQQDHLWFSNSWNRRIVRARNRGTPDDRLQDP